MSAVHKVQHHRTVVLEFQCSSLAWLLRAPSIHITEALSSEPGEVTVQLQNSLQKQV